MASKHPHHPIIYVRGFAATQNEIEETVADPYMGFNIGSTKIRTAWDGKVKRYYFESPLVRLMNEHHYNDVYIDGEDILATQTSKHPIPYQSIIIYRYYDEASKDFGAGETPPIEHFAKGLSNLVKALQEKVCSNPDNDVSEDEFRVYLVAHSMGGLICRAFLQNPAHDPKNVRHLVDKVFTYATPHNGIDMRIVRNVPGWLSFGDANNFNRERMAGYLGLAQSDDVSVVENFPVERIFNLVGTNPRDYTVAAGVSAWAAGAASDGLVRIENATTHAKDHNGNDIGSPRAFVYRSHSGHYGIVNSEEGYQNLTRFLFGTLRVDGILDINEISLPDKVQKKKEEGKTIRASYQFEVSVSVRGCQWQLTRREVRENSAMFRTYDEMFPKGVDRNRQTDRSKSPHLFSVFLDPTKSMEETGSVCFAFDLKVLVPDYEVDGRIFMDQHFEGGYILRKFVLIKAVPDTACQSGWKIFYDYQDNNPGEAGVEVTDIENVGSGMTFSIPLKQEATPGFDGNLRILIKPWS